METRAEKIRPFLLQHVKKHPSDIVPLTAAHFNVTPTATRRHIGHLIKDGKLTKSGNTKQIHYQLLNSSKQIFTLNLTPLFDELDA